MKKVRRRDIRSPKLVSQAGGALHSSFFFLAIYLTLFHFHSEKTGKLLPQYVGVYPFLYCLCS